MKHFVHPCAPGRVAVAYMIPGTNVASIVCDYPAAARGTARQYASRLSTEPTPELPPEERPVPKGFYTDTGSLF